MSVCALTQEILFVDTPEEAARLGLLSLMAGISEEFYAAGWMSGLEYDLWDIAHSKTDRRYGLSELTERHETLLRLLSEEAGGWWRWEDGPVFVSHDEWLSHLLSCGPKTGAPE